MSRSPDTVRGLSVRSPWWWYILYGGKDVENRGISFGPRDYRGPVLLHASSWYSGPEILGTIDIVSYEIGIAANTNGPWPDLATFRLMRGGFVGVVDIVDIRPTPDVVINNWETHGGLGLVLANPRPIPFVPYPGALGLFKVDPSVLETIDLNA